MNIRKHLRQMLDDRFRDLDDTLAQARKRQVKFERKLEAGDQEGALESLEWLSNYAYDLCQRSTRLEQQIEDIMDIVKAGEDK